MNRKLKLWIAAAITLSICGAVAGYVKRGGSQRGDKAAANAAVLVGVVRTTRRDVPVNVEATGNVAPLSTVEIRPQTANLIRQVHIKEGQFVNAGALLFTLDDRADRANLDKAQAQLARDQATLADLNRQLKRSQELVEQNFIARSALDTIVAQVEAQRAALRADQAAVDAAKVALSYDTIRAPVSGRAGAINVYAGTLAQTSVPLVTITQIDPITVSFTVPEIYLQPLLAGQRNGQASGKPVLVMAMSPGLQQALSGRLNFIDNAVDAQIGSVRAKALFDNPDGRLWPGQFATVRITLDTLKNAVVIPQAAVITNTAGKFVYVIGANQTVDLKKIETGYSLGDSVVVNGLSGDEDVVVEGKQNLRPGSTVQLASATPGVKAAQ